MTAFIWKRDEIKRINGQNDKLRERVAELEEQIEMAREWVMNIHAEICESVNWPNCCATAVVITHLWPTRPDTETK